MSDNVCWAAWAQINLNTLHRLVNLSGLSQVMTSLTLFRRESHAFSRVGDHPGSVTVL